jgi:hypothetical protein
MLELYDQFAKLSKSEIQHFHKLEQQRKVAKPNKAARTCYNNNHCNYLKLVHNISSDGDGVSKSWNKDYKGPLQQIHSKTFDQRSPQNNQ